MLKVTFVALGSEQLAISLLSELVKRDGHEVNLAFCAALFHDRFNLEIPALNKFLDDTDETLKTIKEQEPDVLICSVLTATYQWMLQIARETKKMFPNCKVVMGGVHISAVPDLVLPREEVDYIVVGEGEIALPAILAAIESGEKNPFIPNTRYLNDEGDEIRGLNVPFKQDLDTLPFFNKELFEPYIFIPDHYITMASRGCPYRCTFCFNNFFADLPDGKAKGKYVRTRSVDHMLDELKYIKRRYKKVKWIDFEDDIFTVNKPWLKEFLPRYKKEIGLPFQCLTHPKFMDDDMAQMLKDAGCGWVQMGIQTLDEDFKSQQLRRHEKTGHIDRALKAMIDAGLKVKVDHMFGLPGEPVGAQELARKLYAEHCPARIQTFWTCFLPGTQLMQQGLDEGILTEEEAHRLNEGIDFYFFRNADNIKNPGLVKTYECYQFLFRIYPLLPKFMRVRLKSEHVRWIPSKVMGALNFTFEIINAIRHWNPNFIVYGKYYIHHIYKFYARKLGIKVGPAVKPVDSTPYKLRDYDKIKEELIKIKKSA